MERIGRRICKIRSPLCGGNAVKPALGVGVLDEVVAETGQPLREVRISQGVLADAPFRSEIGGCGRPG